MNILCRLGLHSWKPHYRFMPAWRPRNWAHELLLDLFADDQWLMWIKTGKKCRRCHARRVLP